MVMALVKSWRVCDMRRVSGQNCCVLQKHSHLTGVLIESLDTVLNVNRHLLSVNVTYPLYTAQIQLNYELRLK